MAERLMDGISLKKCAWDYLFKTEVVRGVLLMPGLNLECDASCLGNNIALGALKLVGFR